MVKSACVCVGGAWLHAVCSWVEELRVSDCYTLLAPSAPALRELTTRPARHLPACQVHFIIASCENMVDGRGLRPGDVLVASNGKTVEINNTDAEGRLTLADALLYAQKQCGAGG